MSDDRDLDALRKGLRSILNGRGSTSKHALAKASAARTLARLHGEQPEPPAKPRPENAEQEMAQIIEPYCPDFRKLRGMPLQDPMRDLDAAELIRQAGGEPIDPALWRWLPRSVEPVETLYRAEREILAAAERLGLRGPFAAPGQATRRVLRNG
jgi:hypothetical protein